MPDCIKCLKEIPEGALFCPWCGKQQQRQEKRRAAHARGNGSGTAIKRGKTWTARIVLGYKVGPEGNMQAIYATKGGFRTKNDALAHCPVLFANHRKPKSAPTLTHYWDVYRKSDMRKLSDSKQGAYEIAWKRLASVHYTKMDEFDVAILRNAVQSTATSFYTARDMKVLLSHLFKLAAADGFANKDLPTFINLPKLEETEREPFTAEEQTALWQAYEKGVPYVEYALVMIYTGMMPGELLNMTVDMVHLDAGTIVGAGKKTSTRKKAPVVVPDCIVPILANMVEGKTGKVFPFHEKHFYSIYYQALEAAGVRKLPPYSCRHTTATALAITENIAPQTVQKVMRWASTRMLDRYAHPNIDDAKAAVNAIKK